MLLLITRPCRHSCLILFHVPAAGDALSAYNLLRAFSWQIRLSPFPFEDLLAALAMPTPNPLMDELHVSVSAGTRSVCRPALAACRARSLGSCQCVMCTTAWQSKRSWLSGRQPQKTSGVIAGSLL